MIIQLIEIDDCDDNGVNDDSNSNNYNTTIISSQQQRSWKWRRKLRRRKKKKSKRRDLEQKKKKAIDPAQENQTSEGCGQNDVTLEIKGEVNLAVFFPQSFDKCWQF